MKNVVQIKMELSEILCLLLLKMSTLHAAPLQFPLLQPQPGTWQQQQLALQEQMLAIQQFQALQQMSAVPSPIMMNPQQPLLVLFPNPPMKTKNSNKFTKDQDSFVTKHKPNNGVEDEDSDSIIIETNDEADEINNENNKEPNNYENTTSPPMRAILLVPNKARFSIGGFISGIPWLPIEINVPDSISWIYEGISGIISGIGQRWPFNRPQAGENTNTKTAWNDMGANKIMPIVVMPLAKPMLPMQY